MGKDGHKGEPNDIVITFLGATGSGKTNFINTLKGEAEQHGASRLKPDTKGVTPYIVMHANHRLVLVDTPGFDDASRPDRDVLTDIAKWLNREYTDNPGTLKASGIIYLHRITDNRVSDSVHKNVKKFVQLCGDIPLRRVRLVTTMWDKAKDRAVAENRENQLRRDFWPKLLEEGAVAKRFDSTQTCAWDIVRELIVLGENRKLDKQNTISEMDADEEDAGYFSGFLPVKRVKT